MREMTTREIQMVSLDILKDVHEFCVEHDIKYTLFSGTLIGAIRHKGFIPWDDDLDIAFTRPEYEKFVRLYQSKKGYKLFARERQGKEVYLAYTRICEMERTFVDDSHFPWTKEKKGVWIDVFPLDGAESDYNLAVKQCEEFYRIWDKSCRVRSSMIPFSYRKGLYMKMRLLAKKIVYGYRTRIWDKHIKMCKRIPFEKAEYYSHHAWAGFKMREYYKTSAFDGYFLQPFEDGEFYVMNGYNGALRAKYGDYMQLPPVEERCPRHSVNKFYWKD